MDICKFEKESKNIFKINRTNFETQTNKSNKYIYPNHERNNQYYAYCPECLNPIVLVNLFVTQEKNGKPVRIYGKHSVEGNPFDAFDREKYKTCPLKKENQISFSKGNKHNNSVVAELIKKTIIDNACIIKYFISKELGIEISPKLFLNYITEFHTSQGYYYKGLSKGNLPYLILYLSHQKSIRYQYIIKECKGLKEIENKSKFFMINEKKQIVLRTEYSAEKNQPSIFTVFKDHSYNSNNEQNFVFQIFEKFKQEEYLLFEKTITFDLAYFHNLLNYKNKKNDECTLSNDVKNIIALS